MTNRPPPTLQKWPFIMTDLLLLAGFAWVAQSVLPPRSSLDYIALFTIIAAWMFGAWICILPWIKEFQAQSKYAENETLTTAIQQIERLEEVGQRVQTASATWQSAQDAAMRVATSAREIEERIRADSKDFMAFAERISNDERQNLRLEVEKLRRSEGEWVQVSARMLDHTFALTQAAVRSGQPNLGAQMTNFQNACRDAARRVGLIPFHPAIGDAFDERSQQLEDPNAKPDEGSVIADILATGFTFQGQLLRKALVRVSKPEAAPAETEPSAAETSTPEPEIARQQEPEPTPVVEQTETETAPETKEPEPQAVVEESPVVTLDVQEMAPEGTNALSIVEENPSPLTASEGETEVTGSITLEEELVEVATVEPAVEAPVEEEKPRRRQKRADPQTSLPF